MSLPGESISSRGRRKSHNACLPCRRKKTRCPGEKPACSSCSRLSQPCSYAPVTKNARGGRSEERLASMEAKLDLILSGNSPNQPSSSQLRRELKEAEEGSQTSYSPSPVPESSDFPSAGRRPSTAVSDADNNNNNPSSPRPGPGDLTRAMHIYFKHCHRQPIWCFERDEVSDYRRVPDELACSVLALTSRFFQGRSQSKSYGNEARRLVMLRIAEGSVALTTIESLCLLSYSSFVDGNTQLGQFHLGLAVQLCRSAMLDLESTYAVQDATTERKRRLFWSLQVLEQFYGRHMGLPSGPVEDSGGRPFQSPPPDGVHGLLFSDSVSKTPPLPKDDDGRSDVHEPGIWNTGVHVGWIWSRVRKYVSNCAQNIFKEPWRHDSMYATVQSDFMETENRIPMCHRYDSIKFYDRKADELQLGHDYWAAWLKEQFMYHAIPTVLNHPFLYIVGAQHNPNLAIPNTFWRRSSELALLHATWIVRIIDMVMDKGVPLTDPFFGHAAAIAATVHLYYCCAAAPRLKHKSSTDFEKCRRFLKTFLPFSSATAILDHNLDQMTRIAAGPETLDAEDWMPSKIYLSVPLMWDILQFNCVAHDTTASSSNNRNMDTTADLLDPTLAPKIPPRECHGENSTLEIIVATSPEVAVDTADGGQVAPSFSRRAQISSANAAAAASAAASINNGGGGPRRAVWHENVPFEQQTDNLTFNTTPWLYADPNQFVTLGDIGWRDGGGGGGGGGGGNGNGSGSDATMSDARANLWWEDGTLSNTMFI